MASHGWRTGRCQELAFCHRLTESLCQLCIKYGVFGLVSAEPRESGNRLVPVLAKLAYMKPNSMKDITKVQTESQISEVSSLAREIWIEHYTPIIGTEQVEYMLAKFQSEDAISLQISEGYEYYIITCDSIPAAYISLLPDLKEKNLFISKIYVKKDMRGDGFGKQMLEFAEQICIQRKLESLSLTVNRHNSDTIAWYERMGFNKTDEIVTDIGEGYVMDDFKMVKIIINCELLIVND